MMFFHRAAGFAALIAAFAFCAASAAQASPKEPCAADAARLARLEAAQAGAFRALRVAEEPLYLGDLSFQTEAGKTVTMADFAGKTLLVNLWGVWCPPCRREMPGLAALQKAHGGADFAVLTVRDERSGAERAAAFMRGTGAESLPLYRDGNMALYLALSRLGLARGLPVSLLVDKKSCLIASLNGGAPWDSAEARAFIQAALARP